MKKYYYIAAIIVVVAGGYDWYQKSNSTTTQAQYVTSKVEKGTLTSSISGSGNVIVDQSATVDPTISGTVANLAVNVGDSVQEGQFLFDIVNDQLGVNVDKSSASLQSAQSSLESSKVQKKQNEADLSAAKKKNKEAKSSSNSSNTTATTYTNKQIKAMEDKVEASEASIEAAQKSLEAAQSDLNNQQSIADQRKVTAPISGIVNEVNIKNGDDLGKTNSSSSTKVSPIIIGDLTTLKAQVQVNEVDIPNVSIGQKAMMKFSAIDGFSVSGTVEKIDSLGTLSQGVVTYNVTIGFDTLDPRIKPEMSVSASIITAVKQDVFTIPNSALKTQDGNNYVEVLDSNSQPQQKSVQIGIANNTATEVTSGLNEGEQVVTQTITNSNTNQSTSSSSNRSGGGGVRFPGLGGGPRD